MSEITETPQGRVHIDQRTGQPARWIGAGNPVLGHPDPVFSSDTFWQPTTWGEMSPSERKAYKRQYPVV